MQQFTGPIGTPLEIATPDGSSVGLQDLPDDVAAPVIDNAGERAVITFASKGTYRFVRVTPGDPDDRVEPFIVQVIG